MQEGCVGAPINLLRLFNHEFIIETITDKTHIWTFLNKLGGNEIAHVEGIRDRWLGPVWSYLFSKCFPTQTPSNQQPNLLPLVDRHKQEVLRENFAMRFSRTSYIYQISCAYFHGSLLITHRGLHRRPTLCAFPNLAESEEHCETLQQRHLSRRSRTWSRFA